jgi:hypothetical protein
VYTCVHHEKPGLRGAAVVGDVSDFLVRCHCHNPCLFGVRCDGLWLSGPDFQIACILGVPCALLVVHKLLSCVSLGFFFPERNQVWSWLGTLWVSVTGHRFPMSVAVLLADYRRPWRPAPEAEGLWVRLRLLCVAAVWKAHCRRHHGDQTPFVTVIAGLVSRVRELMARDAARVTPDGPLVATVGGPPF